MKEMTDSGRTGSEDERIAARKEIARARSKAFYAAHRLDCAKKAYLRRLPGIAKPKLATLKLYGLDDAGKGV